MRSAQLQTADVLTDASTNARYAFAVALMIASGFAGLGYQIVWTQQTALWLGHESAAVLAVVAAFFGGLAVGALFLSPQVERSDHPGRWYAIYEGAIGLWSLALVFLMPRTSDALLQLIGLSPSPQRHWLIAFASTFLLLLPATAPMGATLPVMERIVSNIRTERTSIAALYAANTLGAVFGVVLAAFVLVPVFGLRFTAYVCAGLNFLCAGIALSCFGRQAPAIAAAAPSHRLTALLAATGLLGIGYEVLVVRILSQVAENTVYTFAILLAIYLIGTAMGAAIYERRQATRISNEHSRNTLLQMLAAACLLGTLTLGNASDLKHVLIAMFGASVKAALAAEGVLAAAAFLLPAMLMGALFSELCTCVRRRGTNLGRAFAANTLGAAIAPGLFGVALIPNVGTKASLLIVAAGYLVLASLQAWRSIKHWAVAAAAIACVFWAPTLAIVDIPRGGRLVSYAEGSMATVSVIEDADGVSRLHIDNRQQEGSSATRFNDARQGLLPVLLHPAPRRVLFLGLGTGVTATSAALDPNIRVDAVELIPEVITASKLFKDVASADAYGRLHFTSADARRFVHAAREHYDVIVADNFHPARSGSGSLYTVEHFQAVNQRLAPGGLFCQWLPLHQLDLETLRSIVASFLAVYPHGWALLATNSLETPVIGLVASNGASEFDVDAIRERVRNAPLSEILAELGLERDIDVLGSFFADSRSLRRFTRDAPLNTDDHPVVAYEAPQITYAPDSRPRDRLLEFLDQVVISPRDLLAVSDEVWNRRLSSYWRARNRFLEAGRNVVPSSDVRNMLAQVREPLLAVLRVSPDFRPAYEPLRRMAAALRPVDATAAHELLQELQGVQSVP